MKRVYWVEWMDGYKQYFGTNYHEAIETQVELKKFGVLSKLKSELTVKEDDNNDKS